MPWKWPWQTREDEVIRLLDWAIAEADVERQVARRRRVAVEKDRAEGTDTDDRKD